MTEIKAIDRIAAEKQARLNYQTQFDYEMALQQAFAEHRIQATPIYDYDPCSVTQNKAGGLWYRRWYKAQHKVMALEAKLEALAEACEKVAHDEFRAAAKAQITSGPTDYNRGSKNTALIIRNEIRALSGNFGAE